MKKMLVAVYGHYDSRGGTTAMPLEAATVEAVVKSCYEYNKTFGWHEEIEQYRKNPRAWSWDPTEPGASPGEQDFLYVAELWYDEPLPDGDLEDHGAVIEDGWTTPFANEIKPIELAAQISLAHPVQLEFVPTPTGRHHFDAVEDEKVKAPFRKRIEALLKGKNKWLADPSSMSSADSPEVTAIRREYNKIAQARTEAWEQDIKDRAKMVKGPEVTVPDWNDDAFGFIIGTGLEG